MEKSEPARTMTEEVEALAKWADGLAVRGLPEDVRTKGPMLAFRLRRLASDLQTAQAERDRAMQACEQIGFHLQTAERERDEARRDAQLLRQERNIERDRAQTAEVRVREIEVVVADLIAWEDRYPASSIYGMEQMQKIAAEMTAIVNRARALSPPAGKENGACLTGGAND